MQDALLFVIIHPGQEQGSFSRSWTMESACSKQDCWLSVLWAHLSPQQHFMLPVPPSVLHNSMLLPKHRGAGGQCRAGAQTPLPFSVREGRSSKERKAALDSINPSLLPGNFQVWKASNRGLGCRLCRRPIASGSELFVWVSRDQERWRRGEPLPRGNCVLWLCCLTEQAGGSDGCSQSWSSRPFSLAPAQVAVLLGPVDFRGVLRVMFRSLLLHSACLQRNFWALRFRALQAKKEIYITPTEILRRHLGWCFLFFIMDNEMTGLPRGNGGGEEGIDCLLVGLCVCRLSCFSCMCALSKSSCSSCIYDKFIYTKRFFLSLTISLVRKSLFLNHCILFSLLTQC